MKSAWAERRPVRVDGRLALGGGVHLVVGVRAIPMCRTMTMGMLESPRTKHVQGMFPPQRLPALVRVRKGRVQERRRDVRMHAPPSRKQSMFQQLIVGIVG